jgi:hypothetical protein
LESRNLQFFAHAELKPTFNEWLDHPALQTRSLNVRERERNRSIRAHWSMSGVGRAQLVGIGIPSDLDEKPFQAFGDGSKCGKQ